MSSEQKEWFRVSHSANGATTVTVTVVEGNLSTKWSLKSFQVKDGIKEAQRRARAALEELKEAVGG